MGDVVPNRRFRRTTARERAKTRESFRRRMPWEAEHQAAMRRFDEILAAAPRRAGRR